MEVDYQGDDVAQAIDEIRPDFLVDVTTPESHCEVTKTALERGVPVLGEKPMASSMAEARSMVRASRPSGVLYMVSQSRRYDPRITAYKRLLSQIGELGILNADFYLGAHFGGFRDEMDHVLLLDMAIHTFDQARFLTGADPVSVYCEEFNPPWSWYRGAACATAEFEMSGGLRFSYRGSWCSEGRNTSWESEWRAVGAKGSAEWDGDHRIEGDRVKSPTGFIFEHEPLSERALEEPNVGIAGSLRDFLKALNEPTHVPMARCDDNIMSLAMVFAAVQSAEEGRRIEIAPLLAESETASIPS
jgi:predicted dehydrogenase